MLKAAIKKVVSGNNLTLEEARQSAYYIMNGDATPSQIASLLTALHIKGETVGEITGFAEKMREFSIKIDPKVNNLVDTCGTGGDSAYTFNISSVAAFVVAGAGVPVAKHGNRSVSSKCGSADLLESFGYRLDLGPQKISESIEKIGFGFLFAPLFHPAMKHAGPARREIGFRTIFNLLGPMTNPAGAKKQVVGVYSSELVDKMSKVLKNLKTSHSIVVFGSDGLDEVSTSNKSFAAEIKRGLIKKFSIDPKKYKIRNVKKALFKVSNVEESKLIALSVLEEREKGPYYDIVVLNAAVALLAADEVKDIEVGILKAQESIDSGRAFDTLKKAISFSRGE